jgi:lipopolysaccharide transport system ATP-binding protein
MDRVVPIRIDEHRHAFTLTLPAIALLSGKYFLRAHAGDPEGVRFFDSVEREFVVSGETRELGLVALQHRWHDGVLR